MIQANGLSKACYPYHVFIANYLCMVMNIGHDDDDKVNILWFYYSLLRMVIWKWSSTWSIKNILKSLHRCTIAIAINREDYQHSTGLSPQLNNTLGYFYLRVLNLAKLANLVKIAKNCIH